MFAGFLEFRLATMGNHLPGIDRLGHGQPLHAHVCHSKPGRIQPEPQEH